MLKKSELPPCPIALTIGLIGSKWKLFLLRELVLNGERHFGELLRAVVGISKKSLTESLRALEADGLVTRREEPGRPPRAEEKEAVIQTLYRRGVFNTKGAVREIADALGISEPTVYRYLHKIKTGNDGPNRTEDLP